MSRQILLFFLFSSAFFCPGYGQKANSPDCFDIALEAFTNMINEKEADAYRLAKWHLDNCLHSEYWFRNTHMLLAESGMALRKYQEVIDGMTAFIESDKSKDSEQAAEAYFFRAIARKDGRIGTMEDSFEDLKQYRELIAKIRETNPEYCSENQGKIDYANGIYEVLCGYLKK